MSGGMKVKSKGAEFETSPSDVMNITYPISPSEDSMCYDY